MLPQVLRRAIAAGQAPTLQRWLTEDTHLLRDLAWFGSRGT